MQIPTVGPLQVAPEAAHAPDNPIVQPSGFDEMRQAGKLFGDAFEYGGTVVASQMAAEREAQQKKADEAKRRAEGKSASDADAEYRKAVTDELYGGDGGR